MHAAHNILIRNRPNRSAEFIPWLEINRYLKPQRGDSNEAYGIMTSVPAFASLTDYGKTHFRLKKCSHHIHFRLKKCNFRFYHADFLPKINYHSATKKSTRRNER